MLDGTTKHPLKSRGVWGGIFALGGGIAGIWGYTVTPEDVQSLSTLFASIGSSVGGIVAIFGRIKARHQIG